MALQSVLSPDKSTSGLKIALHPLVILTISDYITRHTLRNQPGPLIGALLGQQSGSQISIEHAFEVNALNGDVDVNWFTSRLEDMKAVHKSPPLDFIGIYTLLPPSGPTTHHSTLLSQFLTLLPDSASASAGDILLLGFHPQLALTHSTSGSLPVSIYEFCDDASHKAGAGGGDVEMSDVTVAQSQDGQAMHTHFHSLAYTIESAEAERIAVDFVARGSGGAMPVTGAEGKGKAAQGGEPMTSTKKRSAEQTKVSPAKKSEKEEVDVNALLSPDEAEMITSLTAKANAVRMLQSRITLMSSHLSAFEGPTSSLEDRNPEILRSISALLARLPLVVPSSTDANGETDTEAWDEEQAAQRNDVALMGLLAQMTESVAETKELGKKFAILNGQKKGGRTADFDVGNGLGAGADHGHGGGLGRGSFGGSFGHR